MDPIDRLANLIETVLAPQLTTISNNLSKLSDGMEQVRLSHQKHEGRICMLEHAHKGLKCEQNTDIMRGHGARIAQIERHIENGHRQNAECIEKNKKVDEALSLAKENQKKNHEQEERYKAVIRWLSTVFSGVLVLVLGSWAIAHFLSKTP